MSQRGHLQGERQDRHQYRQTDARDESPDGDVARGLGTPTNAAVAAATGAARLSPCSPLNRSPMCWVSRM